MKRELYIAVIIVVCVLAGFILSIVITEKANIKNLQEYYQTHSSQQTEDRNISIPAPAKEAYKFEANKVTVWTISLLWGMAVPAFFLLSRWSSGIRDWAHGKSGSFLIVVGVYFVVFTLINYLINLPLDFYSGFARLHAFGLSNQTFWKWMGDSLKSMGISLITGTIVVIGVYLIIRRFPGYWWLIAGLLSIPVMTFYMYISPVYIDPLFNKYVPLKDKTLETEIYQLLDRTTIGNCKVYGIDKSVDTNQMNAYMTGMFGSKRIVLWDTTMNNLDNREILTIVAHEMGHYLMGHIWKSILFGGLGAIFGLFVVNKSILWIIAKSGGAFGFNKLADVASLPLIILVLNLAMFVASPVMNAVSRYDETEADRFSLELTRDNQAFSSAMIKLHQTSLSLPTPGPVYKLWVYDHPTLKERIDFGASYKPWTENKPLKYKEYIKK